MKNSTSPRERKFVQNKTFYLSAISTTDCTPGTGTTCETLDSNAECVSATSKCSCKANWKSNAADDACVKVVGSTCGSDTDCSGVSNTMCDTTCKCKGGYKTATDTETCAKILGQSCQDTAGCSSDDANSVCKADTCQCKDYYKEITNVCAKILSSTCSEAADCSGGVTNSMCDSGTSTCKCNAGYEETSDMCTMVLNTKTCAGNDATCTAALANTACGTDNKCTCATNYVKQDAVCKVGNEQTCTADGDCLTNAECTGEANAKKCMCKSDYTFKDDMCKVQNSAQSVVLSTGLFVVSLLVMLQNFV
ncbi:stabilin-2-like [Mercenaria mercenaria]|uniref:stabilin-2-like n=1 Tax=Mercenaria mercenaria TaxID=6596 RepID=UPI00234E5562|nr:stabilin-2-like [Mercenaria mercenaria]